MRLFLPILFCFILTNGYSQVDSFSVNEYNFKFDTPEGWTLLSKDTGICKYDETNLKFEWPSTNENCFGYLMVSISEITPAEKKKREEPREEEEEDPRKQGESAWEMKYSGFNTYCGYYDARPYKDSFAYIDRFKKYVIKKREASGKKNIPVHHYARWIYFPVQDSLEILIYFQGIVPHYDEADIDWKMNRFASSFYKENKETLDSLIENTGPYRNEPDVLPMDSLSILKTFIKYPLMPDWKYDTARTSSEVKTTFLHVKSKDNEICNHAELTLSWRITTIDNKAKPEDIVKVDPIELFLAQRNRKEEKPISDSARKEIQDSSFNAAERHYYFTQQSDHTQDQSCATSEEYTESLNIFVYTKTDERIKITVSFAMVSPDPIQQRDYYHAYYRFIYFFAMGNDFEKIYLLNKP